MSHLSYRFGTVAVVLLILVATAVGLLGFFSEPREWSTVAGSLQAVGGLALVLVTLIYVQRVDDQTHAVRDQAEATQRTAEAAEKSAKAAENQAELFEQREKQQRLQDLRNIDDGVTQLSSRLVELTNPLIGENTLGDEDFPYDEAFFDESLLRQLESSGVRLGTPAGTTAISFVRLLEKVERKRRWIHTQQLVDEPIEDIDKLLEELEELASEANSLSARSMTRTESELKSLPGEV